MANIETPGLTHAPTKRFFPISIYRAMESALLSSDLPAKLRATMSALAAYADRHEPATPIRVEQETLAERLGRSPKTISRHLDELVDLGWITKSEQRRRGRIGRFNSGRFAGCLFVLTTQAITALGLAPDQAKEKDRMSDGHTGSERTTTNRQPATKAEPGLPSDLQWLSGRLDKPGIFALMRKATTKGKRLADILAVTQGHLEKLGLEGRRLFGYLAKLATSERCFQVDAQRLREGMEMAEKAKDADQDVQAFKRAYGGKVLATPDGKKTFEIHASGDHAQVRSPNGTATMLLYARETVMQLVNALRTGKIVAVT